MKAEPTAAWPSLGIVVPVYNEAAGIETSLRRIVAVAERYEGRAEAIAVDDGSADQSAAIIERLAAELEPLHAVRRATNGGYGVALRSGAERAGGLGLAYVAFIDSDLTNPPEDLLKIGPLAAAGFDYIKGSRFRPGGGMEGVPPSRSVYTRTGNLVGRALFGGPVRDVTNGFRAVRTDLYLSWPLRETGFPVIVEEMGCALGSGASMTEFPTVLTSRTQDQRPTSFTYGPALLASYLRYPMRSFRERIFRR